MGRFGFYDDEDSLQLQYSFEDTENIDSENFNGEETPHPIPFSTQLSPRWSHALVGPSKEELQRRQYTLESMFMQHHKSDLIPREQYYPPSNHYWDPSTTSVSSMIEYEIQDRKEKDNIDGIMQLLQVQRIPEPQHHVQVQNEIGQKMKTLSDAVANEHKKLEQWEESYQAKVKKEHSEAFSALRSKLKTDHAIAKKIIQAEREEEKQQADEARREQEALDEAKRKKEEEKERIRLDAEKKQAEKVKKKAEAEQKLAEKYAFATRGKKLVGDLVKVREYIQPFDSSKAVSKRRMAMKRLCRGRVNTISADVGKIQSVSRELIESIKSEKEEDKRMKGFIDSGNPEATLEMARGHDYFIDLLASSIMVRIQAEGFNGPRGDGFPLAGFLATVAAEIPEFVPVLEGHVYTVCPLVIPFVASLDKNAGEDELMGSLGMIKNKEGAFESFERFLQRTEGIISIMANVMSSLPSNHKLFGGHEGAMQWLDHFLDLLPSSPEQLPLFTASVLDAFLTGSGNMLANLYTDTFKEHITNTFPDILKRLDEGAIGAPSAHRLKETLKMGFEGFINSLPPKALPQMYNNGGNVPPPAPALSFGLSQPSTQAHTSGSLPGSSNFGNNPFGQAAPTSNNSFGASTANNNPFGQTDQSHNSMFDGNNNKESEMGDISKASSGAGFGATQHPFGAPANNESPFGAVSAQPTSFGPGAQSNNANPFGASNTGAVPNQPNSFGFDAQSNSTNPFGASNTGAVPNQPNSFGFDAQSNSTNPFGASNTGAAPNQPNSSGFDAQLNSANPFGASNTGGNNFGGGPFGGNNNNNNATGSSFSQSTPFGNPAQQNNAPFNNSNAAGSTTNNKPEQQQEGNKKAPCKFFAQGKCRYGDNCRFSHETPGNQGATNNNSFGFGNTNSTGPGGW